METQISATVLESMNNPIGEKKLDESTAQEALQKLSNAPSQQ